MALSRSICPFGKTKAAAVLVFAIGGFGAYYFLPFPFRTAHAKHPQAPMAFRGFGFTTLRLQSVRTVNHDTKRFVFEFADPNAKSGLTLTSALLTLSWPKRRWFPVPRPYTPINDLNQKGSIELMVKRYPNGKASSHLHSLSPGDHLTIATTLKGFPWTPNKFPRVYLIAGGAGITPIYQLIQGILNNPNDKTKINLVFGVNTEQDLLLKDELEQYKRRFPDRFDYLYTVSRRTEENSILCQGRVTEGLLRDVMQGCDEKCKVFVCGPPGMEEALLGSWRASGILERLGVRKDQVYKF